MKNLFQRKYSSLTPAQIIDELIRIVSKNINLETEIDSNSSLKFSRKVILAFECLKNGDVNSYNKHKPKEVAYIFNPFGIKLHPLRGNIIHKNIESYKSLAKHQTFQKVNKH